jgi:nucleotide-binding universal stress UspA family protein
MNQTSQLSRRESSDLCRLTVFPRVRISDTQLPRLNEIGPNEIPPAADYRNLLVPLDGSQTAEHALPQALAIARRSGATVRLMHVHSMLKSLNDPWRQFYGRDVGERQHQRMQDYLDDVVRRISRADSIHLVAVLSKSNEVVESLCRAAEECDLVVMATHGRGLWRRFWHGGITDSLLRRLDCPLLIVRGHESPVDLTGEIASHRRHAVNESQYAGLDVSSTQPE